MPTATRLPPPHDRYFEDYSRGSIYEFGSVTVTEAEILEFAERYDPQPFHIDQMRAKESIYGGIIASGWHTSALLMRLLVDNFVSSAASMGSPGVDEIRWPEPVRPGDVLSLRVTVLAARVSNSKPDRGILSTASEMLNQKGTVVMTLKATSFVRLRAAVSDCEVKSKRNGEK